MTTIAMIHVAKSALGLDDDTYRAKLMHLVGKSSTKDMTEAERLRVLDAFTKAGFEPKHQRRPANRVTGRYASALQAFWLCGWNLGVIQDRDDKALIAFARRQTGLGHVRFVVADTDARAIIEAIKGMVRRETDKDWLWRPVSGQPKAHFCQDARVQVLRAQYELLIAAGVAMPAKLSDAYAGLGAAIANLDGPVLIEAQKHLGAKLRSARKAAA